MRLVLVGLVLTVLSCQEPAAPVTDLDAIRVDVAVVPGMVILGTDAQIVVTLKNTSRRTVEVPQCPVYFWIQDGAGNVVKGSRNAYCALAVDLLYVPLQLKPFESKTFTFDWPSAETQTLALGFYRAYGWLADLDHVSAPVSVRVIAATTP
jgi:hypothetical protein